MNINMVIGGMSKVNKPPLSLFKLIRFMKGKGDTITVVVGTMTDDIQVYKVPNLKVTALRLAETARVRIEKVGGECLTFSKESSSQAMHGYS